MSAGSLLSGSGIAALTAPADNPFLLLAPLNGSLAFADKASGGALTNTLTGSGAVRWQAAQGARTNLQKNPSFAVDTLGWSVFGTGNTITRITNDSDFPTCVELFGHSGGSGLFTTAVGVGRIAAPGAFTISFDAKLMSGANDWKVNIQERDAAGTALGADIVYPFTPTATAGRVVINHTTVRAGVHSVAVQVYRVTAVDGTLRLTNFVVEAGTVANPTFFAGVWLDPLTGQLGTANFSPSVSQAALYTEEATTNLVQNPRFETNATGWANYGNNDAASGRDTTQAYLGVASYKMVTTSNVSATGITTPAPVTTYPVSPSLPYTLQARVKNNNGGNRTFSVRLEWYDAGSVFISALTANVVVASADSFQLVSGTLTSPANAAYVVMRPNFTAGGNSTNGDVFWITNIQLEQKAYATSYVDGAMGSGYAWTGTAHASASTRTASSVKVDETNRISAMQGAIAARALRMIDTNLNQLVLSVGPTSGAGGLDSHYLYGKGSSDVWANSWYSNNQAVTEVTSAAAPVATWAFLFDTWIGTTQTLAVDAGAQASGARTPPVNNLASAQDIGIGTYNATAANQLQGLVGPIAIFARPLTAKERTKLSLTPLWNWHTLDAA